MTASDGSAPSWLFSFVDLAFLLLIAVTQLSSFEDERLRIEALALPQLSGEAGAALAPGARNQAWQLRVHPPMDGTPRFELRGPGGPHEGARLEGVALAHALRQLAAAGAARPLLAPHPDSRSEDLLAAVDLLETLWRSRRDTLFERVASRP